MVGVIFHFPNFTCHVVSSPHQNTVEPLSHFGPTSLLLPINPTPTSYPPLLPFTHHIKLNHHGKEKAGNSQPRAASAIDDGRSRWTYGSGGFGLASGTLAQTIFLVLGCFPLLFRRLLTHMPCIHVYREEEACNTAAVDEVDAEGGASTFTHLINCIFTNFRTICCFTSSTCSIIRDELMAFVPSGGVRSVM